MTTDTTERGLERLICTALTGSACDPGPAEAGAVHERPAIYGAGWICGAPEDYDREYCADLVPLTAFLRDTQPEVADALDLGLFINGLPVATFELKNSLTKQTVADAVEQYQRDRDPREKLFEFGRCVVHFAVDDHEVRFCTHLKSKGSWFLP
jgi:hypothetical protein